MLVKSVMQPGERARARVAVRFPHEGNAAGFAFVTDQRVLFEFREKVVAVALAYVSFVGRPEGPSLGDFVVTARTPAGPVGGEFTTTMKIRDADAFHGFFPTLLDAVRAAGALPDVDAGWGGEPGRVPSPRAEEPAEPLPAEVVDRALATFMADGERIATAEEMVCDATGGPVTLMLTQRRFVVVESQLIWAAPLRRTKLVDAATDTRSVCVLAEEVTDSLVLGGGLAAVDPGERRMTLRPAADGLAGVRLRAHLLERGGGLVPA